MTFALAEAAGDSSLDDPIENIRKILAGLSGDSYSDLSATANGRKAISRKLDDELGEVVLRHSVPALNWYMPERLAHGEILDCVLQQLDNTNLPMDFIWMIALECSRHIHKCLAQHVVKDKEPLVSIKVLHSLIQGQLKEVCAKLESDTERIACWMKTKQESGEVLRDGLAGVTLSEPSSGPISVKALRNARRTMEDRHVIIRDLNTVGLLKSNVSYQFFGVYDGHGGRFAADFCAAHLHLAIANQLSHKVHPTQAIVNAIVTVDHDFESMANQCKLKAGSTVVVALLEAHPDGGRRLYVGWLGDAEAVLGRAGGSRSLVRPHRPSVSSEAQRIRKMGGVVMEFMGVARVNGDISVSRALGVTHHKPYVCSDAEVETVEVDDECDFVVLGCDGLFDYFSASDIVGYTYHAALSRRFDITHVADKLVDAAIRRGSTDNITALVVSLRDPKKWHYETAVSQPSKQTPAGPATNENGPSGASFANGAFAVRHDTSTADVAGNQSASCDDARRNQLPSVSAVASSDAAATTAVIAGDAAAISDAAGVSDDVTQRTEDAVNTPPSVSGDLSPVENIAAEFVRSTVERALNKVNEATSLESTNASCDLSPPEGDQRDLIMASLKDDTPEADRLLNPDAPEFVPFHLLPNSENDGDITAVEVSQPESITTPSSVMAKSESRDELVYEVDRQLGTAPQPGKAELVNLDASVTTSDGKTVDGIPANDHSVCNITTLSESEKDGSPDATPADFLVALMGVVNGSMNLGELIVRDSNIHVIPEESPADETPPSVVPTEYGIQLAGASDKIGSNLVSESEKALFTTNETHVSTTANSQPQTSDILDGNTAGRQIDDKPSANEVLTECFSDYAEDIKSQLVSGTTLKLIEDSTLPSLPAAVFDPSPAIEAKICPDAEYLLSAEGGVHEEVIVPRSVQLCYDDTKDQESSLISSCANGMLPPALTTPLPGTQTIANAGHTSPVDDGPKIVDAIEKTTHADDVLSALDANSPLIASEEKQHFVDGEDKQLDHVIVECNDRQTSDSLSAKATSCEANDNAVAGQPDSLKLGSIQDIMEKLSPRDDTDDQKECLSEVPDGTQGVGEPLLLLPQDSSLPEAEGVQDADSESDNDGHEWSFVKLSNNAELASNKAIAVNQPTSGLEGETQLVAPSSAICTSAPIVASETGVITDTSGLDLTTVNTKGTATTISAKTEDSVPKSGSVQGISKHPQFTNAAKVPAARKAVAGKTPANKAPTVPSASRPTSKATSVKTTLAKTISSARPMTVTSKANTVSSTKLTSVPARSALVAKSTEPTTSRVFLANAPLNKVSSVKSAPVSTSAGRAVSKTTTVVPKQTRLAGQTSTVRPASATSVSKLKSTTSGAGVFNKPSKPTAPKVGMPSVARAQSSQIAPRTGVSSALVGTSSSATGSGKTAPLTAKTAVTSTKAVSVPDGRTAAGKPLKEATTSTATLSSIQSASSKPANTTRKATVGPAVSKVAAARAAASTRPASSKTQAATAAAAVRSKNLSTTVQEQNSSSRTNATRVKAAQKKDTDNATNAKLVSKMTGESVNNFGNVPAELVSNSNVNTVNGIVATEQCFANGGVGETGEIQDNGCAVEPVDKHGKADGVCNQGSDPV